jgi:NADPH:quinone reductase and related Zn-dependent oxidoreductases
MKAVVSHVYGDADVLQSAEVDRPRIGDDDVLVRVRAAGVERASWHVMTGTPYAIRLGTGLRRQRVPVRGRQFAGVVEAIGRTVTTVQPGDEVYGTTGSGSWAQFAVTRPSQLTRRPMNVSFEQAAVAPISGGTALQAVRDAAGVRPGQRVLVIGAAGSVGSFAVQIAVALGARVTGVCAPSAMDAVRSLGAEDTIDYTREDVDRDGPCYDAIIDTAGNRPLGLLRRALTRQGILVIVGGEGAGRILGMGRVLRAPVVSLATTQRMRGLIAGESRAVLDDLRGLIESGAVTPLVDRIYPLDRAADAMRHLAGGHPIGNVALAVE